MFRKMNLLDQRLRPLYDAYICRNIAVRHALRLTCKRLHEWIPVDKEFVFFLSMLSGKHLAHMELTGNGMDELAHVRCGRVVLDITCHAMGANSHYVKRNAGSFSFVSVSPNDKQHLTYGIVVTGFPEKALGCLRAGVVDRLLLLTLDLDTMQQMYHVMTSILSEGFWHSFYEWRFCWDSGPKVLRLERIQSRPL